jgi:HEAT repeat protein
MIVVISEDLNLAHSLYREHGNSYTLCEAAIETLGYIGRTAARAVPFLKQYLKDADLSHQSVAISLGQIGTVEAVAALIQASHDSPRIAEIGLLALGAITVDAMPLLIEALHSGTDQIRTTVAYKIGERHQVAASAVPALVDRLDDTYDTVIQYAARSLWLIGNVPYRAAPSLIRAMESRDEYTRRNVYRAFSRVIPRTPETVSLVLKGLQDDSYTAHEGATDALEYIGSDDLAVVLTLLADERATLRKSAVEILRRLGTPEAQSALEKARSDLHDDVRAAAVDALEYIRARNGTTNRLR